MFKTILLMLRQAASTVIVFSTYDRDYNVEYNIHFADFLEDVPCFNWKRTCDDSFPLLWIY